MNQELNEYIKRARAGGQTDEQSLGCLYKQGWTNETLKEQLGKEDFMNMKMKAMEQNYQQSIVRQFDKKKALSETFVYGIFIFLLMSGILFLGSYNGYKLGLFGSVIGGLLISSMASLSYYNILKLFYNKCNMSAILKRVTSIIGVATLIGFILPFLLMSGCRGEECMGWFIMIPIAIILFSMNIISLLNILLIKIFHKFPLTIEDGKLLIFGHFIILVLLTLLPVFLLWKFFW